MYHEIMTTMMVNDVICNCNGLVRQDFMLIMKWIKYRVLTLVVCTVVRPSTPCLTRYITRPIIGYHCSQSIYSFIKDIGLQQCIGACISDKTCWTLSYNHSGEVCALEEEPCVTASKNNDFSLTILRSTHFSRCLEWMPFNKTYGSINGIPKRAVQVPLKKNRMAAVARRDSSEGLLTGKLTTMRYEAYMMDSERHVSTLIDGY